MSFPFYLIRNEQTISLYLKSSDQVVGVETVSFPFLFSFETSFFQIVIVYCFSLMSSVMAMQTSEDVVSGVEVCSGFLI